MCSLVNNLGGAASAVTVSYDFAKVASAAEEVEGHRAYYSLTGDAGSWIVIPEFSSAAPGRLTATLSLAWPNGGTLYLLWADDNGSPSPDTANQIDNFSAVATPATQVPASITVQPQSQSVGELDPVTFTVSAAGNPAPTLQWYTNSVAIPGATGTSYSIASTPLSYHGLGFRVVVQNVASNVAYSVPSSVATLTVIADTVRPVLLGAAPSGLNLVVASFSERLASASVGNVANYSITGLAGSLIISNAVLDVTQTNVLLTVSTMTPGSNYVLTVNGVTDQSAAANAVAPGSQAQFTSVLITFAGVGSPSPGSVSSVPGGYDITGAGRDIGGTNDQFHFNYQQYTGDFDVKVRVESLSLSDAWAKAGLMARENLTVGSRYAASLATPNISGSFFQYRALVNGPSTNAGSFPATYPNTWLRLKRTGNVFAGYAGVDGNSWMALGSATIALPLTVPVGLAVTSRTTNQLATTAKLRGLENVTGNPPVMSQALSKEPMGPSSRKTGLVISEIMYHPRTVGNFTNRSLEFIEIFNSQSFFENIGNHRLSGAIEYTFPPNTVLQPGAFVVVARDPAFVQSHYGISGVLGPWDGVGPDGISTNNLPGGSGRVRLRNPANAVLLEVNYRGEAPWPIAADGAGHSLVLSRPSYGEGDVKAWDASDSIDGSPGRLEPFSADSLSSVVINEFLAHTDFPLEDFVELYNHGNQTVDLSGAYLTDEASTNKFRIPNGTTIPPRGFLSFDVSTNTTGFALSSGGERIYLVNSNQTRVIDALDFGPQENGVSTGRIPDGAPSFYRMAARTPGAANSGQRNDSIVINEIMYAPISGDSDDEYVELYNRGNTAVNVGEWRFVDGIDFTIPANTVIASNGYLVVARKASRLLANYPNLNSANTVGDYSGTLANGGERLALAMPEYDVVTNNNIVITNIGGYIVVNEVTYGKGGRWGNWSDGGGSSLELKDARSDNRQPANWADSDETSKGIWTTIEVTGNIGETLSSPVNDNLEIFLLGIGECLVDEVEVRNLGGTNIIGANYSFENGLAGWTPQGSHDHSTLENVGFASSSSLHLRAASRGDNGANRVRSPAFQPSGVVASSNVTLRCRAKWIRGWPELLLRLHGGGLEVGGRLAIQPNLGTPGAVNSRVVPNAGPAIYDVVHGPILPAANEVVVVTARASDPNTPFSLALKYRVEPATTFSSVVMVDNGTAGDSVAGDGIYSARIPGQATGATVAFYVEGTDSLGAVNTFPQDLFPIAPMTRVFPFDAPSRECVIRWGDQQLPGSFGTYRLWLNNGNTSRWTTRLPKLNNSVLDGTFVYNNYRVIYNMRPSYAGSPWHRGQMTTGPAGTQRCDYDIEFPVDDRFLGATDFVWNNPGNPGGTTTSDLSAQSEQSSYEIFKGIGVHYNYRRYVHVFVNGNQRSTTADRPGNFIFEDSQQANGDIVDEWFPDDNEGSLYKIEDWFEFPDNGDDFTANNDADLGRRNNVINRQTVIHTGAYRFMWRLRSRGAGESAVTSPEFDDLLNVVSPASNPNSATVDVGAVASIMDYEQWMRIFACQHTVGNWDSYGFDRGKNGYAYKGKNSKFHHWTWDIDFTMGIGGNGATDDLFSTTDGRLTAMRGGSAGGTGTPAIRRAYWRAFQDIVNGPLNNTYMNPILDAKAAALAANNVNFDPNFVNTIKTYVSGRRNYLLTRGGENVQNLGAVPFATAGTNYVSTNNNLVTISGTAAIGVKDILFNGVVYPVSWTSISNWTARVALDQGSNVFNIQGRDGKGNLVANASRTNTIVYTGPVAAPKDFVVINEIMYNPLTPGAEFVELFNTSSNITFDMEGWRFNGLDYTFPAGAFIAPRSFLVLTKNRAAFIASYGASIPVFDQFDGNLQADGETITLLIPGATLEDDVVIDKVRYEAVLPWPVGTNGVPTSSSIQLIDVTEDNSRPLNWTTYYVPPVYSAATNFPGATNGGWRKVTYTGLVAAGANPGTNFLIFLSAPGGDVYLDDMTLVVGTVPEAGPNILVNGDFEAPLSPAWTALGNHSNSVVSTSFSHSGAGSLHVIASAAGGPSATVRQFIPPPETNNTPYTLTYWFYSTTSAGTLNIRTTSGSLFVNTTNVQPQVIPPFSLPPQIITPAVVTATPGSNNTSAASLLAIPPLWLNELQADNTIGILDNMGEREPWIELYNAGSSELNLGSYYLANNYDANLTQWSFPGNATIAPGEFKIIWADGEPGETSGSHLHTSFRLNSTTGAVALVRVVDGNPQVLDYLTYSGVGLGLAYGDYPDGQPFNRVIMRDVTPGSTNIARPYNLYINEWLAGNTNTIADPADGQFEDWFEVYNPGTNAVDLGGLWFGDSSSSRFQVPNNGQYVVPAGGFLLVWADNEPNQNSANRPDLHVNFQLGKAADTITLYAADRSTIIDSVSFVNQIDDISEGRFPDGSLSIFELDYPTPRSANQLPGVNTPPVMASIGSKSVTLGQSLSFTITATDAQAGQTLTFSIVSGAPAGATLDAGGLFTWNTSFSLVPSTNHVTVRVADNGAPPLTDSETFTLIGVPPPPTLTINGNQVTIGFQTIPGKTYRVEYKDDLNVTQWLRLNNQDYLAAGASLTVQDNLSGHSQRFYRIVQLD
jgi:hypothetical protein